MSSIDSEALKLAKGNTGAITVLAKIINYYEDKNNTEDILKLFESMYLLNMIGPNIWIVYKNWAKEDIEKLMKGISEKDDDMQKMIK